MSQRYNSLRRTNRFFRCQTVKFILEEFSHRWYRHPSAHVITKMGDISAIAALTTLEKEFQRKLNQSRVRSRRCAGDYSKILVVGRAARGIRRTKLRSVEDVEKLGAKLDGKSLLDAYSCSLEQRKVKVADSLSA